MNIDTFNIPLQTAEVKIKNIVIGNKNPLVFIAGPCVIENEEITFKTAQTLKKISKKCNFPLIFKASFDKANRSSIDSFRGVGITEGLRILRKIKIALNIPVLTDVHSPEQAEIAAKVVDVLQVPAFLCRQTDLLVAVGKTGLPINVKKGQFLAPEDMQLIKEKIESTGNKRILFTDRGTSFGYKNLVSDFRGIAVMQRLNVPVVFDAGHSVQSPAGDGKTSGGDRSMIPVLARAAVAAGANAIFVETHPDPDKALSDGPNSLPLDLFEQFAIQLTKISEMVRNFY